ncbi:MAG TPA: hypothetical protein VIQ79_30185 [Kribbella sp.]
MLVGIDSLLEDRGENLVAVVVDDELDEVGHPLAIGLWARPQLEVLRPVVGTLAVLVVHRFPWVQRAADHLLHDQSMGGDLAPADLGDVIAVALDRARPASADLRLS